jgi:hypothetical protein
MLEEAEELMDQYRRGLYQLLMRAYSHKQGKH